MRTPSENEAEEAARSAEAMAAVAAADAADAETALEMQRELARAAAERRNYAAMGGASGGGDQGDQADYEPKVVELPSDDEDSEHPNIDNTIDASGGVA